MAASNNSGNPQGEDLMAHLLPKCKKIKGAFIALDNYLVKVESLLGAKDHLFLLLSDLYGNYGYLQRWTSEYLSLADELTSPFYSMVRSMRVALNADKRNFDNIFIAFQARVDKDAIMRAEARMAVAKWQANAEKNGDGKNKKFEKTKLLASQMTTASELSRIHHEALMEDLFAFGEQCESYFTPSLSSLISFHASFHKCKKRNTKKFETLSSLLANPYLHPIDPANQGPRSRTPTVVLSHEDPLPPPEDDVIELVKSRSNSDSAQGSSGGSVHASPSRGGLFSKRQSTDFTPTSSPPATPPRSPRSRHTPPPQSLLGTIVSNGTITISSETSPRLSPSVARRSSKPPLPTSLSAESSPDLSTISTIDSSPNSIRRQTSRPPSISYPNKSPIMNSPSMNQKPPLNPTLSSPMLVHHSKPEITLTSSDDSILPPSKSPSISPTAAISVQVPPPFSSTRPLSSPPTAPNSPLPLSASPANALFDTLNHFLSNTSSPSITNSPSLSAPNLCSPIAATAAPLPSIPASLLSSTSSSALLPASPLLNVSSSPLLSSSSSLKNLRSVFPTSPSLDSITDVTSNSMDMAMLFVELAAGESGMAGGVGGVDGASIIGGPNGMISPVGIGGGGGKGGSVGRYTNPVGSKHGRFSVDVSRLAQMAVGAGMGAGYLGGGGGSGYISGGSGGGGSGCGSGYGSGSEDGGSPTINSSSDSIKPPTYTAKTAEEVIKSFDELLANPLGLQYFHEFVKSRVCEENILFWMDVQEYKNFGFRSNNIEKSKQPAKKIYATYLKQGGEKEVNIPESLREAIAERLSEPTATMFDEAQAEVLSLMRSDSFSAFAGTEVAKRLAARLNKKDFSIFIPSHNSVPLRKGDKDKEKEKELKKDKSASPKRQPILSLRTN